MAFQLAGHVAVVTGNSTGLGKEIGKALGAAGAKVAINYYNNEARANAALAEYQQAGIETMLVRSDVTSEAGVDELITQVEQQLGPVDIIVPNATCEQPLKPIEEYDWD
ncbi:MAG TPA: 3-oxoacyl-ACP reductase, partial [Planctomycetaceae bacterium]|nr:3-oxoacyl-ACP reductase [Planctomycetaceae bacterium]